MNETLAGLESVKNRVAALRKSGHVPYWRLAFAEFSLNRISDYIQVGALAEASEMTARLVRWLDSHERPDGKIQKTDSHVSLWNESFVQSEIERLKKGMLAQNYLIPVAERIVFSNGMDRAQKLLAERNFDAAHSELLSLRSQLIFRLHRSYRARASMLLYNRRQGTPGQSAMPSGTVVGPYNAEKTLQSTLSLVGERDAIWVEDFLELYDGLSRIADRLAPIERKKR